MGAKTLFKWTTKITPSQVEQLIRAEKDVEKARLIFDSATAEYSNGFRHDHSTFACMISKLVSANQFRTAEEMLHRMKEEKCHVMEDIFLSICRAYGRVHRPLDAIRIFHKMDEFECKPTQKSYITIFAILVEENQLKVALRFYQYMKEMGVPVNVVSINILIKALCKNSGTIQAALKIFQEMPSHGCHPDLYTYGTLINGMCRVGKLSEAKKLFEEMKTKGFSPSVVTYTSLMNGFCQSKNIEEAMGLFDEMKRRGIEPNVFTYSTLMDGLCKNGCSSKAMELLELMTRKRQMPNIITYSTLINGLSKEGRLSEAVAILDRMKLQGLKPDAGLYGKIIVDFCKIGKFQEAANFLDEMVLGGVSPNRLTWNLHVKTNNMVVQGLCSIGDLNRAFQFYLSIRTRGMSVDVGTFHSLVKCYCKKGDLQKVARIVDEMVIDGCFPDKETWTAVVGGFWDHRKVQEAFESLLIEQMNEFVANA